MFIFSFEFNINPRFNPYFDENILMYMHGIFL
jgi:hypothetical protein